MGAADGYGKPIVFHQLSEELCPVQVRDSLFHDGGILRIVRMDGRCKDDEIDVVGNVFPALSDQDTDP